MTAAEDDRRLVAVAWLLDRLRWVPTAVLDNIVRRDGLCFWAYPEGDPPDVTDANHRTASWRFSTAPDVLSRTNASNWSCVRPVRTRSACGAR
jgi:hypothetical protein